MSEHKFLIDECLSPELAEKAVEQGHPQSTCVRNRGWCGLKDYQLIERVIAEDFTLVTCNSVDFRGKGPGQLGGEHAKQELHAGLVCLNSELTLDLDLQHELFQVALDAVLVEGDLMNKALDVFHQADGGVQYDIYDIPAATQGVLPIQVLTPDAAPGQVQPLAPEAAKAAPNDQAPPP